MKGFKKLCIRLLTLSITFLLSLSQFSNVNAVQNINSWLSLYAIQKTSSSGDWIARTLNNASVLTYSSGYVAISHLNASASVSNLSGSAWSGNGYLNITIDNSVQGGFVCPSLLTVYVRPEQGTRVSENAQIVSCSQTSQNPYYNVWTIQFQSSGTLSQLTSVSTFYVAMASNQSSPMIQYNYIPGQTTSVQLTGSINFTMTTDANTSVLGEINQSITSQTIVIKSELQNVQELQQQQVNILEQQQQQEQQDRDNIEQQQEETNQQATETSSDVQESTTNIVGVISGFSEALNNIETGNCTLPTISAYGFSLGNINLCTYNPPNWVQGAVSIVVSLITLKLAIAVFYRIMGALDGVIGGKK